METHSNNGSLPSVFFINPIPPAGVDYGFTTPPIGLSSLAATISNAGYSIDCFDMQLRGRTEEKLLQELREKRPDVVCVTMTSMVANYGFDLVRAMRAVLPEAQFIAGGVHPTVRPEATLRGGFDMAVIGEGEHALLEILRRHGNKDKSDIQGVATLYADGTLRVGKKNERIHDLDNLPLPELKAFGFPDAYSQFSLTTSRGCPHACLYCGSKTIFGRRVEFHSPSRVLKELSRAIYSYGQREGVFVDDTLNVNQSRLNAVLDGLITLKRESGVDFSWSMNSRIDSGKRTDWEKVARAGCRMVSMGIETGSERILRDIDKGIQFKDVVPVAKAISDAGMEARTTWIVGLPGSYEEQLESIPLMLKLAPYVTSFSVHNLLPLPGTPYGDTPEKYGIHFDEKELLKSISFNALPSPETLRFDYLSREKMIEVFARMEDALCTVGFKAPANAKHGDRLIRTPINRGSKPVEAVLREPSRNDLRAQASGEAILRRSDGPQ